GPSTGARASSSARRSPRPASASAIEMTSSRGGDLEANRLLGVCVPPARPSTLESRGDRHASHEDIDTERILIERKGLADDPSLAARDEVEIDAIVLSSSRHALDSHRVARDADRLAFPRRDDLRR